MKNVAAVSFGVVVVSVGVGVAGMSVVFSHKFAAGAKFHSNETGSALVKWNGLKLLLCRSTGLAWSTGKCVFSLSAVEAATVAKEILIFIHNARSTQTFCTQFSHFRVFISHESVHVCVSGARCSLLVCIAFFSTLLMSDTLSK